jgi:tetratricopeptide (TPR) repeat protein
MSPTDEGCQRINFLIRVVIRWLILSVGQIILKEPDMENSRLEILLNSLKGNPHDAFTRYLVALELSKLKRHEEAIAQFETLVKEHPNYLPTYYPFAQLYENLGRNDEAIRIYKLGLGVARNAHETHTASEIQAALDVLGA